jgi:hypothetical protein
MHWTNKTGYSLIKVNGLTSLYLDKILVNANSLGAYYECWAIYNPQNKRVLELIFFPFIQLAEIHDKKNNLTHATKAASPQEAVQKYFHQAGKTAEQADAKIESKLQFLAK